MLYTIMCNGRRILPFRFNISFFLNSGKYYANILVYLFLKMNLSFILRNYFNDTI